uniref:CRIM domain-containing protein n=1 Tax=Mucochytrium quahogii TaxID=96639 RepID=A0A7S2WD06_9STRA|mmetsp:Transcript_10724/g.17559  ORF Transcript_10724/g.17559 Transcript_10724/m.17559 type:complete len:520 (-) Transcript_10724:3289-4848(-)
MEFSEPAELEDLISLLRFERMLEIATVEMINDPLSSRSGFLPRASLFGNDMTVSRLFASSPPEDTYLIDEDEYREDYNEPVRLTVNTSEVSVSRKDTAKNDNGTKKKKAEVVSFNVQEVEVGCSHRAGALSALLGEKSGGGPSLRMTFYLGDRSALEVRAPLGAKVSEAIECGIKAGLKLSKKLSRDARRYELRIHEEDGLPDLDFPALDGMMRIENFCEDSNPEFCLCLKAGEFDSSTEEESVEDEDEDQQQPMDATQLAETIAQKMGQKIVFIKIYLPELGAYMTLQVKPGMKAVELLAQVQAKRRLPLFTEEYQFTVKEEDRVSLGLLSDVIDMNTDLYESGIRNVELRRRKYADTPSEREPKPNRKKTSNDEFGDMKGFGEEMSGGPKTKFDPDNFVFNDLTAAVYEEWNVVKTNKWGKRQRRVFGLDYQKIYNKKQRKDIGKNVLSNSTVKRAERFVADVLTVNYSPSEPNCFSILWKDQTGVSDLSLKYEVEDGPEAAAYIIAKMRYILSKKM